MPPHELLEARSPLELESLSFYNPGVARIVDPAEVAAAFRQEIRADVASTRDELVLVGFLAAEEGPSRTYAEYTRKGCEDVGVRFDLRQVHRLDLERAIREANVDPGVHGIMVYYPIFDTPQDAYLRDLVDPGKDIEGLHTFWVRCLYENRRFLDAEKRKKAILPCTPVAILKLLDAAGVFRTPDHRSLAGLRACIFNRSEVVGRPLASMMANDGAEVFSFDKDGAQLFMPGPDGRAHEVRETACDRRTALAGADIVITGVPSRTFPLISANELREGTVCLNFSTLRNFEDDARDKSSVFIPRVGPMTVTMALRNTLRLYRNMRM